MTAATETFVKERMHAETGKMQPVGIDDACMFLAVFANGSMGTFESTRYARGRKNYNTFELNGEAGSVFFDLEDPQYLAIFQILRSQDRHKIESHLTGWQKIHVTNSEHPYMKNWWVPGCTIGYEHTFINALADFLKGLETGKPVQPDFRCACGRKRFATPCWPVPNRSSGSRSNRAAMPVLARAALRFWCHCWLVQQCSSGPCDTVHRVARFSTAVTGK